ncbi:MAG: hypothetical protein JST40_11980 [Armatimonadetes bacterium]|nr:hypothetical protein [Armatimonadota bacterium]
MKRLLIAALVTGISVSALAQVFTIRTPVSGSTVRETVKVRIPKNSIPDNGYIAILINDQFLEAVSPKALGTFDGKDFVYSLNTKERGFSDGNLKIDAVLYGMFNDTPKPLNKTSVRLRLDNHTSIKAPDAGFKLRYRFNTGSSYTYKLEYRQTSQIASEAQVKLGVRPPELRGPSFHARYEYEFMNSYAGQNGRREGLVRLQVLPDKGKDYALLPTTADPQPKRYTLSEMYPIYMRITDTGREVFGRSPIYLAPEGISSENRDLYLWGLFPLPVLPTQGVSAGSVWQGSIIAPSLKDFSEIWGTEKLTDLTVARGTLEAIEYERGERCAKIRYNIASGKTNPTGAQVAEDEYYWFSLDRGMIVKLERTTTATLKVQRAASGGGGGGTGGGRSGRPGIAGQGTGGGGAGSSSGAKLDNAPDSFRQNDEDREGRGRPGGPGAGFSPGGNPMGGGTGRTGGGGGTQYIISKSHFVLTLE